MKMTTSAITLIVTAALGLAACGGGDDDTTSAGDTSTATASTEAFCQKSDELQSLGSTFTNLQPGDIEGAKTAFQQALDKINEADAVAPEEIKGDVDTVASVFSEINDAIQGADSAEDLQSLGQTISSKTQELQSALANVQAYDRENCS
jgi:major membrane immunogen (membrane-anchored lipoprotein)